MLRTDGCQYRGCEDVATEHVVVPDAAVPHDVFLCPGHAPYVRRALHASNQERLALVVDQVPGSRLRVVVRQRGESG
jgi:hypothetical protein